MHTHTPAGFTILDDRTILIHAPHARFTPRSRTTTTGDLALHPNGRTLLRGITPHGPNGDYTLRLPRLGRDEALLVDAYETDALTDPHAPQVDPARARGVRYAAPHDATAHEVVASLIRHIDAARKWAVSVDRGHVDV